MVEKKQVVYDLMLKYNGPLTMDGFYKETETWIKEKGLHREVKRKSEDVTAKGKKVEWVVEAWKSLTDAHKHMVKMRVLFNNVKEKKIKRKGKNVRIHEGDVFVVIDGWLETSLTSRWTQAPLFAFFQRLYDKYIWMIMETYDGAIQEDCYDLHKRLKAFLKLYRMKVK